MIGLIVIALYAVFFIPLIIKLSRLKGRRIAPSEMKWEIAISVLGIVIVSLFLSLINFDVALLWYKSLGFLSAFLTRIKAQIILYVIGFVFSWAVYSLFFYIPKRREELEEGKGL